MKFIILQLILLFFTTLSSARGQEPPLVAPSEARTPEEEKKAFKLPPGFEAQLVASEPAIAKPMNLAFDAKGRLWVTSSLEYPYPAQGRPGRDMVTVLDDFGPDGKARKVHTFAKDLNIPMGVLPRSDGALVFSISSLDHFSGQADSLYTSRRKLYDGFGFRDTHGMINSFTMGYDGWVYACHGYANDTTTRGSDGQELKMNSGNVFRFKPDGSHVEIFTRGQVNPFGLCFDAHGNLYSADCHTKPMTQLIRGAYYDSFGKPHDGLGYGPNMMGHLHDSTGLCGIVYYDADAYPSAYRNTMFVCNVVTCRINHDRIELKGSTPEAIKQPDFMTSDDPWYRPVYMTIGPDGCIYVADFYNKIIGHYEVPLSHPGRDRTRGRIWRIVYKGTDAKATPPPHGGDLSKCSNAELISAFKHPNISVRLMALHQFVERGSDAAELLKQQQFESDDNGNVMLLWARHRLEQTKDIPFSILLNKAHPLVQEHTLRILAEMNEWPKEVTEAVIKALESPTPFVRRQAAEALGTHPQFSMQVVKSLLAARKSVQPDDTHLMHTVRIALRNQLGRLPSADLDELSQSDLLELSDIALGISTERGGRIALRCLKEVANGAPQQVSLARHINRFAPDHAQGVLDICQQSRSNKRHYAALLQAQVQGLREAGRPLPDTLKSDSQTFAHELCTHADPSMVQLGIDLCSQAKLIDQFETVSAVVNNPKVPDAQRTSAVNAIAALDAGKSEGMLLAYIVRNDLPAETRERAASIVAGFNKPALRSQLFEALKVVPSRLANVIAYSIANNAGGADELLTAVEAGKVPPSILLTTSVQSRIFNHNRQKFRERYAKLTQGLPPADVRLAELVALRGSKFAADKANAENGAKLFKQHCGICHQLNNQGSKVGPQLDGVGIRGVERLLEDILDPNRNVDQAFRATIIVLRDGRTLTGLVLREEGNLVVLADSQGKEQKFDKNDIEERKQSNLSPMPATMDTAITENEMNDLVKYLLDQKAKQ